MMMTPVGVVFPVFRRRSRLVAPPAWTYIALSDEGKAMTDTAIDTAARPEELGTLPEWDLRDLYSDPDSPELQRSEEHTSELQSLMRISYAVFCLKKKKNTTNIPTNTQ